MNKRLLTRGGLLRRTAGIVALSAGVTLVLGWLTAMLLFGTDADASVKVGYVRTGTLAVAAAISAALSGILSYRSGRLLQELMRAQDELLRIARTDPLTGLMNRRGFDEAADTMLRDACAGHLPAAALMCDVDHFKAINDGFGHAFGDAVLAQIGEVFRAFAGVDRLLVARHGGEEFAMLMVGVTVDEAAERAERLREMCAARPISHDGTVIHVTVSIGIAESRGETDLAKVMRSADEALYAAKRGGRNCVVRPGSPLWQLDLLDEDLPLSPDAQPALQGRARLGARANQA